MSTTTRILPAVAAAALAATLSGCNSDSSTESPDAAPTFSTTESGKHPLEEPEADVFALYNEALDGLNLENDRFSDPGQGAPMEDPTGDFEYSLVDINGDDTPEMLVAATSRTFNVAKVFAIDRGDLIETNELFPFGAATAGGARAEVHSSSQHEGLFRSTGTSGNGQFSTSRWTLEGREMVEGETWDYRMDQKPAEITEEQVKIEWTPSIDRAPLGGDDGTQEDREQRDDPGSEPPTESNDQQPTEANSGRSKAEYPNFGGNSSTSDEFSRAVYNAFIEQYIATGTTSPTLTVASPVTGKTYTMTCAPSANYVNCTGGNNAAVGIYPPIEDPSMLPDEVQWG